MAEVTAAIAGVSELAVLRALERAGRRLLGRPDRNRLKDVLPWDLHIHLTVEPAIVERLLAGAWDLPRAVGLPEELIGALDTYSRTLLTCGLPFDRDDLRRVLARLNRRPQLPWEESNT